DQDQVEADRDLQLVVVESRVDGAAPTRRAGGVLTAGRVRRRRRLHGGGRIGLSDVEPGRVGRRRGGGERALGAWRRNGRAQHLPADRGQDVRVGGQRGGRSDRDPRSLPRRVVERVVVEDRAPEVDDTEEQEEQN